MAVFDNFDRRSWASNIVFHERTRSLDGVAGSDCLTLPDWYYRVQGVEYRGLIGDQRAQLALATRVARRGCAPRAVGMKRVAKDDPTP